MDDRFYTDINQSKKLVELGISPDTADMYYQRVLPKSENIEHNPKVGNPVEDLEWYNKGYTSFGKKPLKLEDHCIPCWSLNALFCLLPKEIEFISDEDSFLPSLSRFKEDTDKFLCCYDNWAMKHWHIGGNAVDAVFKMVCWLKENSYL